VVHYVNRTALYGVFFYPILNSRAAFHLVDSVEDVLVGSVGVEVAGHFFGTGIL
jgi:hypothetical protein